MKTSRGPSPRWSSVFVVTLAIIGILMMHGFEATLIRTDAGEHHAAQTLQSSVTVDHADACSPEIPTATETKVREDCVVTVWAATMQTIWRATPGHEASNRDVLAAFSILIV